MRQTSNNHTNQPQESKAALWTPGYLVIQLNQENHSRSHAQRGNEKNSPQDFSLVPTHQRRVVSQFLRRKEKIKIGRMRILTEAHENWVKEILGTDLIQQYHSLKRKK